MASFPPQGVLGRAPSPIFFCPHCRFERVGGRLLKIVKFISLFVLAVWFCNVKLFSVASLISLETMMSHYHKPVLYQNK